MQQVPLTFPTLYYLSGTKPLRVVCAHADVRGESHLSERFATAHRDDPWLRLSYRHVSLAFRLAPPGGTKSIGVPGVRAVPNNGRSSWKNSAASSPTTGNLAPVEIACGTHSSPRHAAARHTGHCFPGRLLTRTIPAAPSGGSMTRSSKGWNRGLLVASGCLRIRKNAVDAKSFRGATQRPRIRRVAHALRWPNDAG